MSEKTQLASNSPQFAYLEYFLQLSLRASSARILSAHALSNPHLTVQFEKRCADILTLDAWIDPALLPPANAEDEVVRRGFVFSPQSAAPGIRVGIGSLKVSHTLSKGSAADAGKQQQQPPNVRRAILCKVGIGRAYINNLEGAGRDALPDGYDSCRWRLALAPIARPRRARLLPRILLTSPTQILPLYIVTYEYDPSLERKLREKPHCDNCETHLADVYCAADAANLCKSCDTQLHSANKVVQRHVRTPIGKGADVFGHCRLHPDKLVEFFCSQCHVPVCVYCKMVGHHAAGEAARHKLVSVTEAYQTVTAEAGLTDTLLGARKAAIASQLNQLAARAKLLDKHAAQIQAAIDDMYKKACADLAAITLAKQNVLASDECELQRQKDEIERLEKFLTYQQEGDATQFLFGWARHQQLRQELREFRWFRESIDVHMDIKCSGGIVVLADSKGSVPASPRKDLQQQQQQQGQAGGGAQGRYAGGVNATSSSPHTPIKDRALDGYHGRTSSGSGNTLAANSGTMRIPTAVRGGAGGSTVGGMAAGLSPAAVSKYAHSSSSPSRAQGGGGGIASGRKSPGDFFAEALGALDDASVVGGNGTVKDFMTELSFADGEGYISD
ncbi:hypothetical protein BCR44DRAFT_1515132 [Catenaria anguillulae PL171]|uniref:B box-type domain-containing protein n=1 Tax=Catenaria anguillulae PL171 TaxID=765915 RepID=A0A1Y2HE26_9FUNG|nr:hypothetical protein BCR44DRAFT_1515132 [Catenaria anguillulae PL171]